MRYEKLGILQGWSAIESFMGESRMTLTRKKYPVKKDAGGSVWADPEEMRQYRIAISAQICSSSLICAHMCSGT